MKSANFLQQMWTYLQFCKALSRLWHGYFPILFEGKVKNTVFNNGILSHWSFNFPIITYELKTDRLNSKFVSGSIANKNEQKNTVTQNKLQLSTECKTLGPSAGNWGPIKLSNDQISTKLNSAIFCQFIVLE